MGGDKWFDIPVSLMFYLYNAGIMVTHPRPHNSDMRDAHEYYFRDKCGVREAYMILWTNLTYL